LSFLSPRFENGLLSRLSGQDLALLGPMERVELAPHNALEVANRSVESIYFIERGFASVVADDADGGIIEVGLIGPEGMTGLAVVHGVEKTPFSTVVQGGGSAVRVDPGHLRAALTDSPSLHQLFMRYAQAFAVQVASTASANGRLLLEQRVARWLLMVGDRLGESFQITHEFLSIMLAVRRAGVTRALQDLEARGLIRTMRGIVAIIDRNGLAEFTNGAYGLAEKEYAALLGPENEPQAVEVREPKYYRKVSY
jgi:CRP-like cAMP-binding protein